MKTIIKEKPESFEKEIINVLADHRKNASNDCLQCLKYEGVIEFIQEQNRLQAERIEELLETIDKVSHKTPGSCKVLKMY